MKVPCRVSKTNSVAVSQAGYLYNPANQRTRNTQVDGSYWVYAYDSLGQVVSGHKYWSDGSPVAGQQFDYSFDDIGNRKSEWEGGNAGGAAQRRSDYTLKANGLNQYQQRTVPGGIDVVGAAKSNATVTVNNQATVRKGEYYWKEFPITNGASPVWMSLTNFGVLNNGASPDIVSTNVGNVFVPQTPEQFGFDDDGNLISDGRWSYGWDPENRLTNMVARTAVGQKERLKFDYDWQGRRIHKQVWTNWSGSTGTLVLDQKFVYDGWNLIASITTVPSTVVYSYAWGMDLSGSMQGAGGVGGLLMVNCGASGTNFVAFDGNGNVAGLLDAVTGTNSAQYDYDPFGRVIRATGPLCKSNPFRFSTKFTDDETDLVCYGYRFYIPSAGRWLSRDPIQEEGGLNLYGFADNNALSFIDDLGETIICTIDPLPEHDKSEPDPDNPGTKRDGHTIAAIHVAWSSKSCCPGKSTFEANGAVDISYWWVKGRENVRLHELQHVSIFANMAFDMDKGLEPYLGVCLPNCVKDIIELTLKYHTTVGEAKSERLDCKNKNVYCRKAAKDEAEAKKLRSQLDQKIQSCLGNK